MQFFPDSYDFEMGEVEITDDPLDRPDSIAFSYIQKM